MVVMWREEGDELRRSRWRCETVSLQTRHGTVIQSSVEEAGLNKLQEAQFMVLKNQVDWRKENHDRQRFLTQWVEFLFPETASRRRSRFTPEDKDAHFGCFEIEDFH